MSCDAELQELMVQVDRMVEEKKIEWQEKIKNTETKLTNVLKENFSLKSIIEDKNNEIANFKSRMKYKDNVSNIFDYDQEVLQLRLELSQIKKSYEKYYHKYTKKTKEIEKDKEDLCKEKIELLKEVNELRNFQRQYNDEKIHYQEQIREIELKKTTTMLDRETLNEQLKLLKIEYNDQLNKFVESEQRYLQHMKELENKLQESKNCLQHETEENNSKLNDMMQHLKKSLDEKQQLIIDNESAKRMIIRLENELSRVSTENKVKEKNICKMEQVIKVSEKTINEKNEVIRALQVNSASKDYVTTVSKLENELLEIKSHLKMCKKAEKSYQAEIQMLQKKVKETQELSENEKMQRSELEFNLEQLSKLENEKIQLLDKIKNVEDNLDMKTSEISNFRIQLEKMKLENENLKYQLKEENEKRNKNNNINARTESRRKSEDEIQNSKFGQSTESVIKERNYLLKFCEDKDLIIHRLQLENRILQEFISKLNSGLSDGAPLFNPDMIVDNSTSTSDIFHPLKETFTEFDLPLVTDKPLDNQNRNKFFMSSQPTMTKPVTEFFTDSTDSLSNINYYSHSHENLQDNVNKSSEEFLTRLICSETGDNNTNENGSYLNLYPTLAAAKYFTEEREKTRQIERMIDYHMNQLKKETENKRCVSNH